LIRASVIVIHDKQSFNRPRTEKHIYISQSVVLVLIHDRTCK